jgi:hypothetical protein
MAWPAAVRGRFRCDARLLSINLHRRRVVLFVLVQHNAAVLSFVAHLHVSLEQAHAAVGLRTSLILVVVVAIVDHTILLVLVVLVDLCDSRIRRSVAAHSGGGAGGGVRRAPGPM